MSPLIQLSHVSLRYPGEKGMPSANILENIDLTIQENDIVAILGLSGCGKSTLIRLIAGLISPTEGTVMFRGQTIHGVCPGVGMVFQNFALFPWLTVAGNVALPLRQTDLSDTEIAQRVDTTLTTVGLDSYHHVYPRELSGGMKQRVGIARALAVHPDVLCMDEPFSALDVLTAEALRNEMARLCADPANPLRTLLTVTHNIEESVFLARRIIVLAAHPGRIALDLPNPLPYPRQPDSPAFREIVDKIHSILTLQALPDPTPTNASTAPLGPPPAFSPLPQAAIGEVMGLVSLCTNEPQEIFGLADDLNKEFSSLLGLVNAAEMLGLASTPHDAVVLTPLGARFQAASVAERKQILRERMMTLPIFQKLCELIRRRGGKISFNDLLCVLAILFPMEKSEALSRIIIGWGRYAEVLAYASGEKELSLANSHDVRVASA